jgi:hypothetical protein
MQALFAGLSLPAVLLSTLPLALPGGAGGEPCTAEQLFQAAFGAPECAPTAEHDCDAQCQAAYQAGLDLPQLLSKSPELWPQVAPLFRARFDAGGADKDRAIDLLASVGSPAAVALGDELVRESPESFCELQVLAFAEQGSELCAREVADRLVREKGSALGAAWFAFQGKTVGQRALVAAAAQPVDPATLTDVLVSAAALGALGDQNAFPAARARVHAAVLAALDQGQLESARAMALGAELLIESLEQRSGKAGYGTEVRGKALRTSHYPHKVAWHVKQASAKLTCPDAVFELIESVIPVS